MLKSGYSKFLTIILIIVIIALLTCIGYFVYTYIDNRNIEEENAKEIEEFLNKVANLEQETEEQNDENDVQLEESASRTRNEYFIKWKEKD